MIKTASMNDLSDGQLLCCASGLLQHVFVTVRPQEGSHDENMVKSHSSYEKRKDLPSAALSVTNFLKINLPNHFIEPIGVYPHMTRADLSALLLDTPYSLRNSSNRDRKPSIELQGEDMNSHLHPSRPVRSRRYHLADYGKTDKEVNVMDGRLSGSKFHRQGWTRTSAPEWNEKSDFFLDGSRFHDNPPCVYVLYDLDKGRPETHAAILELMAFGVVESVGNTVRRVPFPFAIIVLVKEGGYAKFDLDLRKRFRMHLCIENIAPTHGEVKLDESIKANMLAATSVYDSVFVSTALKRYLDQLVRGVRLALRSISTSPIVFNSVHEELLGTAQLFAALQNRSYANPIDICNSVLVYIPHCLNLVDRISLLRRTFQEYRENSTNLNEQFSEMKTDAETKNTSESCDPHAECLRSDFFPDSTGLAASGSTTLFNSTTRREWELTEWINTMSEAANDDLFSAMQSSVIQECPVMNIANVNDIVRRCVDRVKPPM